MKLTSLLHVFIIRSVGSCCSTRMKKVVREHPCSSVVYNRTGWYIVILTGSHDHRVKSFEHWKFLSKQFSWQDFFKIRFLIMQQMLASVFTGSATSTVTTTYVTLIKNVALYCLDGKNTQRNATNIRRMSSLLLLLVKVNFTKWKVQKNAAWRERENEFSVNQSLRFIQCQLIKWIDYDANIFEQKQQSKRFPSTKFSIQMGKIFLKFYHLSTRIWCWWQLWPRMLFF